MNIRFKLTFLIFFFNLCISKSQFNETLGMEIASLNKKFTLNGIEKSNAMKTMDDISTKIPESKIESLFPGKTWKYSHTVNNEGRQYRVSNAIKRLDFSADGNSFFIKGKKEAPIKTYCKWEYSVSYQLSIYQYENDERTESIQTNNYGVHSITTNRLVLTKIVKSKEHSGTSAISFIVYFR